MQADAPRALSRPPILTPRSPASVHVDALYIICRNICRTYRISESMQRHTPFIALAMDSSLARLALIYRATYAVL